MSAGKPFTIIRDMERFHGMGKVAKFAKKKQKKKKGKNKQEEKEEQMKIFLSLLAVIASVVSQPIINSCGGNFKINHWVINPPNPQAGDTVTINATGIQSRGKLAGGQGNIQAFLFGLDVFSASFSSCNETLIDIDGFGTGILDAPICGPSDPILENQSGKIGFVLPIPGAGSGLGTLNVM